ncbi:type IV pilus modification PilV family protein [Alkalithermobacter paradoxus]|uniref:Prepilin-type N-terminal cleavage/methylation domain-containing protein n=1 Tax=Alkalithermobacter paradoxus TaxID=29349 RepID=A0A1V4I7U2_9FIRM|nr:hypothetical protein CLOTH_13760 [[Clostridium] thermoalcaliphilum]
MKKYLINNNGISLIEVIVTVAIVSLSFSMLLTMYISSFMYSLKGKEHFAASSIAGNYIENMRNYDTEKLIQDYSDAKFYEGDYVVNTQIGLHESFKVNRFDPNTIKSDLHIIINDYAYINDIKYEKENVEIKIDNSLNYIIKPFNTAGRIVDNKNIFIWQIKNNNIHIDIQNNSNEKIDIYFICNYDISQKIDITGYNYSLKSNIINIDNEKLYNVATMKVTITKNDEELFNAQGYTRVR